MKISVIMASFLGDYPNAAKNRDKKFIRAVNSFLKQSHKDKELIIVADGCQKTKEIYEQNWKNNTEIKFFFSQKQALYSGGIRSIGMKIADGDIIAYLDSDDIIGKTHLETIAKQFDIDKYGWVYYDDYMVLDSKFSKFYTRYVDPRYGSIGTSSFSHRNPEKYNKIKDLEWFTGYGHDWLFVLKLASTGMSFKKLKETPQYIVCHHKDGDF